MKKTLRDRLTVGIFLGSLGILSLANAIAPKKDFSELENRELAKSPSMSLSHIVSGHFDDDFENWFSDHFIGRDFWIAAKSGARLLSGAIENNDVYYADDGRLIRRFPYADERRTAQNIDLLNTFSAEHGVRMGVMLVPTSAGSDASKLPFGAADEDQDALYDKIAAELNADMLDVRSSLKENDCYFRTDHHWNEKGALQGYLAVCDYLQETPQEFTYEQVSDSFRGTMYSRSGAFWTKGEPIMRITPPKEIHVQLTYDGSTVTGSVYSEERLAGKDQYMYYVDGNHASVHFSTDAGTGRHAVIIKDSYAHILMPYLITLYDEIDMIDLRYYRDPVSDLLQENSDFYVIYSLDNFCDDVNMVFLK